MRLIAGFDVIDGNPGPASSFEHYSVNSLILIGTRTVYLTRDVTLYNRAIPRKPVYPRDFEQFLLL